MKTPKFMKFDEAKFVQDYLKGFDHVGNSIEEIARYQHQRDLVVMKKLMEIVELTRGDLKNCVNSWGDYAPNPQTKAAKVLSKAKQTLAQVETMLKDLEETNKPND